MMTGTARSVPMLNRPTLTVGRNGKNRERQNSKPTELRVLRRTSSEGKSVDAK